MATVLDGFPLTNEPDRVLTASELAAIYKDALDSALARFIYQQHMLPGEGVLNRQINEASADYYQWLIDTGGVAAGMTGTLMPPASLPATMNRSALIVSA